MRDLSPQKLFVLNYTGFQDQGYQALSHISLKANLYLSLLHLIEHDLFVVPFFLLEKLLFVYSVHIVLYTCMKCCEN